MHSRLTGRARVKGNMMRPPSADEWRNLAAAMVLQAVKDAQTGDTEAGLWLVDVGCKLGAELLDLDAKLLKHWQSARIVNPEALNMVERRRREQAYKTAYNREWRRKRRADTGVGKG